MQFDPTNWQTWDQIANHPIFTERKTQIHEWSYDPTKYSPLADYSGSISDHYLPFDPPQPKIVNDAAALLDITNLADVCRLIKEIYGIIAYEIVVLDDFTVYVWVKHDLIEIEVYPVHFDNDYKLLLFAKKPVEIEEERFRWPRELVDFIPHKNA